MVKRKLQTDGDIGCHLSNAIIKKEIFSQGKSFLQYEILKIEGKQDVMDIVHTYVPKSQRGQGIASKLCERAFQKAQEWGMTVRPSCNYVQNTFLARHPSFMAQLEG